MDRRLQSTQQLIRFRIDATRCDGQGVCAIIAPEIFALDRYGLGYVVTDAPLAISDPEIRGRGLEASALCPRNAIFEQITGLSPPRTDADGPSPTDDVANQPSVSAPSGSATRLFIGKETECLDEWRAAGGFRPATGDEIREKVHAAGIHGQGGAMFATATKWGLVGEQKPIVIANGSEREPGTHKDRYLLEHRPAVVLDGLRLAMAAVGAQLAFVAIDAQAEPARAAFMAIVDEARTQGLLDDIEIRFQEVPARYVAGEESALIRLIESGNPTPRLRPPFPSTVGLYGRPTLVNNIETLADVALANVMGPQAYRSVGTATEPGTGLFSVGPFGGPFEVVERPIGYPLRALLAETSPVIPQAVLVGGYAGALLTVDQFDITLDGASLRAIGASLGTKSVQTIGPGQCAVAVAAEILEYFAGETAAQCPPCERGLPDMAATLRALDRGTTSEITLADFEQFMSTLFDRGVCRLPDGAARMALSLLRNFEPLVMAHRDNGCPLATDPTSDQNR